MEATAAITPAVTSLKLGDRMALVEYGPLTVVDTVRWAGFQENWLHIHYDRDWAKRNTNFASFIASGEFRQSLLMRALTQWGGPRAALTNLRVRHVSSTVEGGLMRFGAEAVKETQDGDRRFVECTIECLDQDDQTIMTGECAFRLLDSAE